MKFIGMVLLAGAAMVFAFEKNPLLAAMPDTSWLRLGDYNCGRALCMQTLDYSGMVYDFHRHKILLFGGGHATQLWNQTEEFDFETLTWKQLNVPDSCAFYMDSTRGYKGDTVLTDTGLVVWPDGGTVGYDGDVRPISRHTYDQLDMASDTCLMIMSATQCDKGGCQPFWLDYHKDRYIWLFDPVAVRWKRLSPDAITANFAVGTALDPATGLLYMAGGRNYDIHSYDWKTMKRSVVGSCPVGWASCQAMTFNPVHGSMLLFTSSNILEYDIAANTWSTKNPSGNHVNSYLHAVPFDSVNQVFGVFKDGGFSYYSPVTNAWYSVPYDTTRFPQNPAFNCTVYDPVNNAYISLTYNGYYGWTTWAYKLSDTPGRFPGTRGGTRAEGGVSSAGAALRLSVAPNPFSASTRILVRGNARVDNLAVYDITGRKMTVWKTVGKDLTWKAGMLPAGLYVLKAKAGSHVLSQKLLKLK